MWPSAQRRGVRRGAAVLDRRCAVPGLRCGPRAMSTRAIGRGGTGETHRAWNWTGKWRSGVGVVLRRQRARRRSEAGRCRGSPGVRILRFDAGWRCEVVPWVRDARDSPAACKKGGGRLTRGGGALLRLREHGRRGLGFWGGGGVELRTLGPGWGLIKGPRASWGGAPRERPAGIAAVIAGGRCGRRGTSLASGAHESASAASGTSGRASVRLALTSWAQVAGAGRMQAVAERVKAGAWLKPMSGRCARWEAERS